MVVEVLERLRQVERDRAGLPGREGETGGQPVTEAASPRRLEDEREPTAAVLLLHAVHIEQGDEVVVGQRRDQPGDREVAESVGLLVRPVAADPHDHGAIEQDVAAAADLRPLAAAQRLVELVPAAQQGSGGEGIGHLERTAVEEG